MQTQACSAKVELFQARVIEPDPHGLIVQIADGMQIAVWRSLGGLGQLSLDEPAVEGLQSVLDHGLEVRCLDAPRLKPLQHLRRVVGQLRLHAAYGHGQRVLARHQGASGEHGRGGGENAGVEPDQRGSEVVPGGGHLPGQDPGWLQSRRDLAVPLEGIVAVEHGGGGIGKREEDGIIPRTQTHGGLLHDQASVHGEAAYAGVGQGRPIGPADPLARKLQHPRVQLGVVHSLRAVLEHLAHPARGATTDDKHPPRPTALQEGELDQLLDRRQSGRHAGGHTVFEEDDPLQALSHHGRVTEGRARPIEDLMSVPTDCERVTLQGTGAGDAQEYRSRSREQGPAVGNTGCAPKQQHRQPQDRTRRGGDQEDVGHHHRGPAQQHASGQVTDGVQCVAVAGARRLSTRDLPEKPQPHGEERPGAERRQRNGTEADEHQV